MPQRTSEEKRAYNKAYYAKNKEKLNSNNREVWAKSKDKYNRRRRETPEGKKVWTLSNWRQSGLVGDLDAIYEIYLNTTNCMRCSIQFNAETRNTRKCMDHDHETNEYRQMICHRCNITLPKQNSKESYNA